MKTWRLGLWALLLMSATVAAQGAQCLCAGTGGCQVVSGPFPAPPAPQPTSCTVYKAGVNIGTGAVVASSTIPLSNAARCLPADPTYVPGPAGSVACNVTIPTQPVGNVPLVVTATYAAGGEVLPGTPFSFVSVVALPVGPGGLRIAAAEPWGVDQIAIASFAMLMQYQPAIRVDLFRG